jgi:hypothetical protein
MLCVVGCSDFERTTFQTLSSSQAVINQAQTDYEARWMAKTECSYAVISDAKALQAAAVSAMVVYEEQKAAHADLSAQTALVTSAIAKLPAIVVQVKALYVDPTSCGGTK